MTPPTVGGGVFDSKAYDRKIQAERRKQEYLSRQKARRYVLGDIHPNHLLSDKELKRRKAAELAMTEPSKPSKPVSVRLPKHARSRMVVGAQRRSATAYCIVKHSIQSPKQSSSSCE